MGFVTQTPTRTVEAGSAGSAPPAPRTGRNLEGHRWLSRPAEAFTVDALQERLIGSLRSWRDYPPSLRLWFWLVPSISAALGGILRFVRLDSPRSLVFDETYYVKDGYSLLVSGYERAWPDKANDSFVAGNPQVLLDTPEYVVHPPVGKWMIAAGMWLFGPDNPFGWRFGAALTGTLSIFLLALIAQKLFRSLTLGAVAGVLLAVDGHHLVMSRTSLLDIFLMFWVLAAFGALLMDRDDGRRRLAVRLGRQAGAAPDGRPDLLQLASGPWLGIRWWRLAAGVCLGLAVGTKWSGLFFLAGFGLLTVFWDLSARRIAGIHGWISGGILKDGIPAFLGIVPVAALVYTATWTGWFLSKDAYFRNWAAAVPSAEWGWLPNAVRSLAHYHLEAYRFHQGLSSEHPYEASAWSWLVLGRPTSFFYESPKPGSPGCDTASCTTAILSVGNPVIWWGAAVCLGVLLFWWAGRRDWRAGAVLAAVGAGYLPWFLYPERTMFYFYAVSFEPFLVLALVYCLGLVLGQRTDPLWRRRSGLYLVTLFVVTAIVVSAFFYPVWTAETITYQDWRFRMWMPSWI
ncbi:MULTISPECIES: phospholipid carrier-dependent glycosyltransferase [unclassified Arthrobacter]|uniref:dolichyl-phosphate-mannose--protein mannosyltransferase n=1 Tax=unclassified Arthrobacter TaxID=235627 RepID=UPI001CFF7AEA|nr:MULTISPECIES: phospholipid carrier-dependent glycosyltransferase [unclassified Arthrobacter]MCB5280914.1 putative dolichyl-phosphate-mannose--protein mannosyltransferase [Arthrobacter sp. ES1]WGZ80253.1 phospholipid carrier-dependent glycosyltransferase [Arthrobacter sp. EM1]